MESWSLGYDGEADVERHAGVEAETAPPGEPLRLRIISDYI
jgi:hypothetical protein